MTRDEKHLTASVVAPQVPPAGKAQASQALLAVSWLSRRMAQKRTESQRHATQRSRVLPSIDPPRKNAQEAILETTPNRANAQGEQPCGLVCKSVSGWR